VFLAKNLIASDLLEGRDRSLLMPQIGTDEKCVFGKLFFLPNLAHYKNNSAIQPI